MLTRLRQVDILIDRRRMGQTSLPGKSNAKSNAPRFDYVHLRAPLPPGLDGTEVHARIKDVYPDYYFLMVRFRFADISTQPFLSSRVDSSSVYSAGARMDSSAPLECSRPPFRGRLLRRNTQREHICGHRARPSLASWLGTSGFIPRPVSNRIVVF